MHETGDAVLIERPLNRIDAARQRTALAETPGGRSGKTAFWNAAGRAGHGTAAFAVFGG
jgi:hypothetical protein